MAEGRPMVVKVYSQSHPPRLHSFLTINETRFKTVGFPKSNNLLPVTRPIFGQNLVEIQTTISRYLCSHNIFLTVQNCVALSCTVQGDLSRRSSLIIRTVVFVCSYSVAMLLLLDPSIVVLKVSS